MDAEEFYEEFKAALNFLGVGFRGMHQVTVKIEGCQFIMTLDNKQIAISTPTK